MNDNEILSLNFIQKEETEMLKKFTDYLNKNGIKYYIWAGTYLGAIRHKGFIPWDDDIDLIIPRPDYNKLIKILYRNNKVDDNLYGIGFELNNSDWPFLKIINKNIIVDEKDQCDENLWLDVFPLDGVPEDLTKYAKRITFKQRFLFLKRIDYRKIKLSSSLTKNLIKKIIIILLKPIPYNYLIKNYIKYCSKYDYSTSNYVRNNVWATTKNNYIDRDKMEDATYDFEGLKVNGLKDYDLYLSRCYGKDYMELPPVEKRVTHSFKAWKVDNNEESKK